MQKTRISSWEALLCDAIGEDAAMRVLFETTKAPFCWIRGLRTRRAVAQARGTDPSMTCDRP